MERCMMELTTNNHKEKYMEEEMMKMSMQGRIQDIVKEGANCNN